MKLSKNNKVNTWCDQSVLILAHVPESLNPGETEVLGAGDAIRLGIACAILGRHGISADICVNKSIKQILDHPILRSTFHAGSVFAWDELKNGRINNYRSRIFVDHPATLSGVKQVYPLGHVTSLWTERKGVGFKSFTHHLVSELIDIIEPGGAFLQGGYPFNIKNQGHRVGLNFHVPEKWQIKSPRPYFWESLYHHLAEDGCDVTWQEGENDLTTYLQWVQNQDVLVTPNSFGFHLALLLNKGVVLLLGPTWCEEADWIPEFAKFQPLNCPYFPCYRQQCPDNKDCFNQLDVKKVAASVKQWL